MLTSNSNFQNIVGKDKSSRASYLLVVISNAKVKNQGFQRTSWYVCLQQLMEVQECRKLQLTIVRKIQSTLSASTGIASRLWWGCYHSSSFSFIVIDSIVLKDTASAFYISDETEQHLGWFHVTQCFCKITVLSLVFLPNSKHDCSFLSISVGE